MHLLAWLCLKTELFSQLTAELPGAEQSMFSKASVSWNTYSESCAWAFVSQMNSWLLHFFSNYLDIAEEFSVVRWEISLRISMPVIKSLPSSVFLWNMHLPLTISLSTDRIWRKNSMGYLILVLLLFFYFFFFEGSCLVNQIIHHRPLLCTSYIYWLYFQTNVFQIKQLFFWPLV